MPHLLAVYPGSGSKTPLEYGQEAGAEEHMSRAGRQRKHRILSSKITVDAQ